MNKNRFNIASTYVDCQAESHRILNLYTRYMLKKFKFAKYDHSVFKICPRYENYYSHINGLLIKAKKNLLADIFYLNYPPSCCKEIDLIVKRFLLKKYKINVYYNSRIKLEKNLAFKNFRLGFYEFIRDVIFDLREKKSDSINKKGFYKKNNSSPIALIISHDLSNSFEAYKNLPRKLTVFFKKTNINTKLILPYNIGITFFEKLKFFRIFLKKIFNLYPISSLKLSDYHFIILELYNQIYKEKLKEYFSRKKIIFIVCSYIDSRYEPLYYEAAKELKIKYFKYDYSLGYPIKDISYLRYHPDTRKFTDVIFANSNFREEQYKISTSFLENPPEIIPSICPQSDYSANVKRAPNLKSLKFKIGIVDNAFNKDYLINYEDISSLMKLLNNSDLKIKYILQSKRGYLERELKRFKSSNFISGSKGDFSQLENSDLIISIGWQSTALKAASIYKKPLLFYNRKDFPYESNIFSLNKLRNIVIKEFCKKLWLNEKNIICKLKLLHRANNELMIIQNDTSKLLKEIGFYENKIEEYFSYFLKN